MTKCRSHVLEGDDELTVQCPIERTMEFELVALAAIKKLAEEIASNIECEAGFATEIRRHRPQLELRGQS